MKKALLIVGVVGLLGLVGILLFAGSPEPNQQVADASPRPAAPTADPVSGTTPTPADFDPVGSETDEPDGATPTVTPTSEPTPFVVEEVTPEVVTEAVLSVEDDVEVALLSPEQQKELNAATIGNNEPRPRQEQTYTVTWAEDLEAKMPTDLPAEAPVYLLDRPTDKDVFDEVKELGELLGIDGTVIRPDRQNYAVVDLASGDYYLYYDLFHLTFEAEWIEIPVENTAEAVAAVLQELGLLNYEYTASSEQDDFYDWYRFTPNLALPVVSMSKPEDGSVFTPGKPGYIDVAVSGENDIIEIQSNFPNIEEADTVSLPDAASLAELFATGEFQLGDVELQYPGAMPLADKRAFFELASGEQIAVSDATINEVECGYFLETEENLQALMAPVCIAHGQGRVNNYSVLFRVAVPAAQ